MQKFIVPFILTLLTLTSCKEYVDVNNIEERQHGLRYIKGSQNLVNGKVVRRTNDGKIVELNTYKDGKMIGDWFQYGDKGQVMSHGFGIEIKNYEKSLNTDLTYCILSITQIKNDFSYATLYMDNEILFNDQEKLLQLSKVIFADYANKYKIDNLLIFDSRHEYTISSSVITKTDYIIDTIPNEKNQKISIH
jgi:hypothetical protein